MSEWKSFELKELTIKIGSGATPRGGQEAYKSEGISLIRSQNILDFSFSYSGLAFIDGEQAHDLRNVIVEKDDVLINITGDSVARVTKVPNEVLPARVNQHVAILRAEKEKLDSDYLLYYLLNPVLKRHLLRIASDGATRNALTKADLEVLIITAPEDVNKQKEIANLLSVYDQKITLLRQQNQDLEELAQTLFKRWFVEFEFPNENGEPYKSSGGKMVESELGEIPEGWRVGKVKEIAILNRKLLSSESKIETIQYIDTGSLTKGVINEIAVLDKKNAPSRAKRRVKTNSILYSIVRPSQCHYGLLKTVEPNYIASTGFCVIDSNHHPHFLYILLTQKHVIKYFEGVANATASTYPTMRPSDIGNYEITIPDEGGSIMFETTADKYWRKIANNTSEIQTLTQLRDTLLPKLMSGELKLTSDEKDKAVH